MPTRNVIAALPYPGGKLPSSTGTLPGLPPSTAAGRRFSTGIPGEEALYQQASRNVGDLLSGEESPDITRNINAAWGAGSGLAPGSEFLRNRAVDLYGQRAEGRKAQGMKDLLAMMGTFSGTVSATPGQILGDEASQRALALDRDQMAQQQRQFESELAQRQQMQDAQLALENRRFDLQYDLSKPRRFRPTDSINYNPNSIWYDRI